MTANLALCEFVAKNRAAFNQILADRSVKAFIKGNDKIEDAVLEFKKHKKDFDINRSGVRLPLNHFTLLHYSCCAPPPCSGRRLPTTIRTAIAASIPAVGNKTAV